MKIGVFPLMIKSSFSPSSQYHLCPSVVKKRKHNTFGNQQIISRRKDFSLCYIIFCYIILYRESLYFCLRHMIFKLEDREIDREGLGKLPTGKRMSYYSEFLFSFPSCFSLSYLSVYLLPYHLYLPKHIIPSMLSS